MARVRVFIIEVLRKVEEKGSVLIVTDYLSAFYSSDENFVVFSFIKDVLMKKKFSRFLSQEKWFRKNVWMGVYGCACMYAFVRM